MLNESATMREVSEPEQIRLLRRITWASLAVASTLAALKLYAWSVTGSVSLMATLVDSLLDACASLVTFVAVREALVPPDREHRFGHGKAEPLAALVQGLFIGGSAGFLLYESVGRLLDPQPVEKAAIGYVVLAIAIVASLALTTAQGVVARRTGSMAVKADRLHYASDLAVNGGVVLALLISQVFDWHLADPLFALAIAMYILYSAYRLGRGATDMLLDRELPEAQRRQVLREIADTPQLVGWHDLRTRAAGRQLFVQLHVELNGDLTLTESHEVADGLEKRISKALRGAEVIIHQDPSPSGGGQAAAPPPSPKETRP